VERPARHVSADRVYHLIRTERDRCVIRQWNYRRGLPSFGHDVSSRICGPCQ